MSTGLSSAQLKAVSRGQLLGKYKTAIAAELAVNCIIIFATLLCTKWTDQTTLAGYVLGYLITFILQVLAGILYVGLTRFYLNLVCGGPLHISDIFSGFRFHTNRAIALRFFLSLIQLACLLPASCYPFYGGSGSPETYVLFCFFLVVGCGIDIFLSIMFSQVYFILLDFPAYTTRQVMKTSRELMKGHKARFFYICVSLLPYYLLSLLSCGIALIWVIPYERVLFTNFYLDLMHRKMEG